MADRRASTRAPGGMSRVRRPSHQRTPDPDVRLSTSTATVDSGPTTSERAKSVCGLSGTTSIASRLGHTMGPPAENAYAVDPVGVDTTMPSQP